MNRCYQGILDYFSTDAEPRWFRWLPVVLLALMPLYLFAARAHTDTFNQDSRKNDQGVYLRTAREIAMTGGSYFTPRQRTPGYSYLLSGFWNDSMAHHKKRDKMTPQWFERGKQVNIALSALLLGGLWLVFRRSTGVVEAMLLTLAAGFLLFVFRAGYVQPELLYFTLSTLAFLLLLRMLHAPGWGLAIATGLTVAATFFTKAGGLMLIPLFVASYALKLAWDWRQSGRRPGWKPVAQGALVPAVFLVVLLPYFIGNQRVFGSLLYSSYSKHIMWVTPGEKDEMYAVMWAGAALHPITGADFRREFAKIKEEKGEPFTERAIPTLGRYFEEQGIGEMLLRPLRGQKPGFLRVKIYYRSAYEVLRVCLVLAIVIAIWRWRVARKDPGRGPSPLQAARDNLPATFCVAGFFGGYALLYGWYDGLEVGARLLLSLYVPALLCLVWFLQRFSDGLTLPLRGRDFRVRKLINAALLVLIIVKCHSVLTGELYKYYSGA